VDVAVIPENQVTKIREIFMRHSAVIESSILKVEEKIAALNGGGFEEGDLFNFRNPHDVELASLQKTQILIAVGLERLSKGLFGRCAMKGCEKPVFKSGQLDFILSSPDHESCLIRAVYCLECRERQKTVVRIVGAPNAMRIRRRS